MLEVMLQFHKMRDWRVVDAPDASGRRTMCLMLPMDVNGIMLTDGNLPYMRFMAMNVNKSVSGYTHLINPIIHKKLHDELCEKGLLDPEEKQYSHEVGGIRPWGAAKRTRELRAAIAKNKGRRKKS